MSTVSISRSSNSVAVVQPGFNVVGIDPDDLIKNLTTPASYEIFELEFSDFLKEKQSFTLVLGSGFEEPPAAEGLARANCAALSSMEQLKFLKSHGLRTLVMARLHGTLVQNARAVGIEVIVGGA